MSILALVVVVYAQGMLFAWGDNQRSQCNVPAYTDVIMVAAGYDFGIALRSNGSLVGWGYNKYNQTVVPTGNDFIAISAGHDHAMALRSNGTIAVWGRNDQGQGVTPTGTNYIKIDAGEYHNVALRSDGTIYAWGRNAETQCNVTGSGYTDVSAGGVMTVALKSDGSLAAWGTNWNGELNFPSGNSFTQISAGWRHGLALRNDGVIVPWGVNWNNQINVPAGVTFRAMSAGWQHSLAVKTDGSLAGWGLNGAQQSSIPAGAIGNEFAMVATGGNFSIALTGNSDADNDGVSDDLDAYPDDAERAFNNYYPSASGWGTLAYEDLWPQKGDFDFNDLVVDYRFKQVTNSDNEIKDIYCELKLRAIGARYQNAFAIEFPFPVSNVASHEGMGAGAAYNMPLTQSGVNSILKVISTTNDFVADQGTDIYWNTQLDQPTFAPIDLSFRITLVDPIDPVDMAWTVPYNPYIMVNRVVGHEIHLPGLPPTVFADPSLFMTGDDTTNAAQNRYYKTSNNLPWAVNIPVSWKYPVEKKEITAAYLAFKPWAESGGVSYQTWYNLTPGQISSINIYNP